MFITNGSLHFSMYQMSRKNDVDPEAVGDLLHFPIEKALRTVVSSKLKYHLLVKNCIFIYLVCTYFYADHLEYLRGQRTSTSTEILSDVWMEHIF